MKLSQTSSHSQNSVLYSPTQSFNIQSFSNTAKSADTNLQTNSQNQNKQQLNRGINNYLSFGKEQFNSPISNQYEVSKSSKLSNQYQLGLSPPQQTVVSSITDRDLFINQNTSFQKSPKQVKFSNQRSSQHQKNQEVMNPYHIKQQKVNYLQQIQQHKQDQFSDKIRIEDNSQLQEIQNSGLQQTPDSNQTLQQELNKQFNNSTSDINRQNQNTIRQNSQQSYHLQQQARSIIKEETEEDSDFKNNFKDNIENYKENIYNNKEYNLNIFNNIIENKQLKEDSGYNYLNQEQFELNELQKQYFQELNQQNQTYKKYINENNYGENKKVSAIKNSIQNRLEELEKRIQMVNNSDGQVYKVLDQIDHNLQESTSELDNISINSKSIRAFSHRGEIESNKITPRMQNNDDTNIVSNSQLKIAKNENPNGLQSQNFFLKIQKRNSGSNQGISQVQSPNSTTSQINNHFQQDPYIQDNFVNSLNVNEIPKPYPQLQNPHSHNFSFRGRTDIDSERFTNFDKRKFDNEFKRNQNMNEKINDNNRKETLQKQSQSQMNRSELDVSQNHEYIRQNMSFTGLNKSSSELKFALNEQHSRSLSKHKELNKIKDQIAVELEKQKQKQKSYQKSNCSKTLGTIIQQNDSQINSSLNLKTQLHSNIIPSPYSFEKSKDYRSDIFNLSNLELIDEKINQSIQYLNKPCFNKSDKFNNNTNNTMNQDFLKINILDHPQNFNEDSQNQPQFDQSNYTNGNQNKPIQQNQQSMNLQNWVSKNVDNYQIQRQNQHSQKKLDQQLVSKADFSNKNINDFQQVGFFNKSENPVQDQLITCKLDQQTFSNNNLQMIKKNQEQNKSDHNIDLRKNSILKQDIQKEFTPQSRISSQKISAVNLSPLNQQTNSNNEYEANFIMQKQNSLQNNRKILEDSQNKQQYIQQDITPQSNSSYLQGITPNSKSPVNFQVYQDHEQENIKINNFSDAQVYKYPNKSSSNMQNFSNQSTNVNNTNIQNFKKVNRDSRLYQTVKSQIQQKNECNQTSKAQKQQINRPLQVDDNQENQSFQSNVNTYQITGLQTFPANDLVKQKNRLQIKSISDFYGEQKGNSTKNLQRLTVNYQKKVNQINKNIYDREIYTKIENKVPQCINNQQNDKNNEQSLDISRQKSPKSSTNKFGNQVTNAGFSSLLNQPKIEIPSSSDQNKMVNFSTSFGFIHPNLRSTNRQRKSMKFINSQDNRELVRSLSNVKNGKYEEKVKKIISQKVYTWLNKPNQSQERIVINQNKLTSKLHKSFHNQTSNPYQQNLNKTFTNN